MAALAEMLLLLFDGRAVASVVVIFVVSVVGFRGCCHPARSVVVVSGTQTMILIRHVVAAIVCRR